MEVVVDPSIDKQIKKHKEWRKPFDAFVEKIKRMTEKEFRESPGLDGHPNDAHAPYWSVKYTRGDRVDYLIKGGVVYLYALAESHEKSYRRAETIYTASALLILK